MVRQDKPINTDYITIGYTIKNEDFGKFEAILASNMITKCNCENSNKILENIDQELCNEITFMRTWKN